MTVLAEAITYAAVLVLVAVLFVATDRKCRRRRGVYRQYRRRVRALRSIQ